MNLLYDTVTVQNIETVLCTAVGTASHQHGLEACTVCGRPGNVLKDDKAVRSQSALN
jgi:hypothetical protein